MGRRRTLPKVVAMERGIPPRSNVCDVHGQARAFARRALAAATSLGVLTRGAFPRDARLVACAEL